MTTALVLGAGGVTGRAFHLGVLSALHEMTGYDGRSADVLVGTSAGARVAAGLAAGSAADDLVRGLGDDLGAVRPEDHAPGWPARDVRICAVRALNARRVVFGTPGAPHTDLGTAVAASCAIPGLRAPVRVDGRAYVDGGVRSPSNADVVRDDDLDLVLVLSPMSGRSPGVRADLGARVLVRAALGREVRGLRSRGSQVVVVEPTAQDLDVMGVNPMQTARAADVLSSAAASTRDRLEAQPSLVRLLSATAQR